MPLEPRKTIGPFKILERVPKPRGSTNYVVEGPDLPAEGQDFGKYSTAVRFAKQRVPRPTPHIVIFQDEKTAVATVPVDYTIIDGEFVHQASAAVDPAMVEGLMTLKPPVK